MKTVWYLLWCMLSVGWSADLFVFAPNFAKPNLVEKEIGAKVPSASVKAFGRFNDFKAMVASAKPALLIAPAETVRSLGLEDHIRLRGVLKGLTSEALMLVSLNKPINLNELTGKTIGIVATVERTDLKLMLESELKSKPKLNAVTKLEDLIPMLTFQSAEAVLVTSSQAEEFKKRSQANLVAQLIADSRHDNLVVVLIADDGHAGLAEIEKLPGNVLDLLNVEGWKK